MTALYRTNVRLEYATGGPGVTSWWWTKGGSLGSDADTAEAMAILMGEVYELLAQAIINTVSMYIDPAVSVYDPATGAITDMFTQAGDELSVQGTQNPAGANRASQLCIGLYTDNFTGGKRLHGRHFHGPISSTAIGANGQIADGVRDICEGMYDGVTTGTGPRLAVWHRPNDETHLGGYYGDVQSYKPMIMPAVLRSRRD